MRKKYLLIASVAISSFFYACGGGSKQAETDESATETEAVNTIESAGDAIDLSQPSDSKGVGPIKDFELKAFDADLAAKGQEVFTIKCTVCHKVDAKLIGPALVGVTKRRTPEWILNMILNPENMLQQDPIAKALLEEYNSPMNNQQLTKDEAIAILEYFRQLDGAK